MKERQEFSWLASALLSLFQEQPSLRRGQATTPPQTCLPLAIKVHSLTPDPDILGGLFIFGFGDLGR